MFAIPLAVLPKVFSRLDEKMQIKYRKRLNKVVNQLLSNNAKSATKEQIRPKLWKVKLNKKWRLFITEFAQESGEIPDLYLLLIMENHKYKIALPVAEKLQALVSKRDFSGFSLYDPNENTSIVSIEDEDEHEHSDEELLVPEEVYLLGETIFQLSQEQNHLIRSQGSFIAYGGAGTGKTSSATFLLEQLVALNPVKPILFLGETPRIVEKVEHDLKLLLNVDDLSGVPVKIQVTQDFFKEQFQSETYFVDYDDFKKYYNKLKEDSASVLEQACKMPQDIREGNKRKRAEFLCGVLYQELCLLAPWGDYVSIGQKSSYFSLNDFPSVKDEIITQLQAYKRHLHDNQKVDLAFADFATSSSKLFAYIKLDEGQNVTLNALKYLAEIADECCVFMDDNQNTQAQKSNILLKKKLLEKVLKKTIPIPVHRLTECYRCSTAVNHAGAIILAIRDDLAGISPEEFLSGNQPVSGSAVLHAIQEETEELILSVRAQLAQYKETEVAILTFEDKASVQKKFPGILVFHPLEVPGAEFQGVGVLYHPLRKGRDNNADIVTLNECLKTISTTKVPVPHNLKHAASLEDPRHTQFLQMLYMMTMRFSQGVILIQAEAEWNKKILERLSEGFSKPQTTNEAVEKTVNVIPKKATEDEWHKLIDNLYLDKNPDLVHIEELVKQHLYSSASEEQRWGLYQEGQAKKLAKLEKKKQKREKTTVLNEQLLQQVSDNQLPSVVSEVNVSDMPSLIISKLINNAGFMEGAVQWNECLTEEEKSAFVQPDFSKSMLTKERGCDVIARIFLASPDIGRAIWSELKGSLFFLKLFLIKLIEVRVNEKYSNFYMLCSKASFLNDIVDAFIEQKNLSSLTEHARNNGLVQLGQAIRQGLSEAPADLPSLWRLLCSSEFQEVFLKLIDSGVFDDVSEKNIFPFNLFNQVLSAEANQNIDSPIMQLFSAETGVLILHKLILRQVVFGKILAENSAPILSIQEGGNVIESIVKNMMHVDRHLVLVSLINYIPIEDPNNLIFLKKLLLHLVYYVGYLFPSPGSLNTTSLSFNACITMCLRILVALEKRQDKLIKLYTTFEIGSGLVIQVPGSTSEVADGMNKSLAVLSGVLKELFQATFHIAQGFCVRGHHSVSVYHKAMKIFEGIENISRDNFEAIFNLFEKMHISFLMKPGEGSLARMEKRAVEKDKIIELYDIFFKIFVKNEWKEICFLRQLVMFLTDFPLDLCQDKLPEIKTWFTQCTIVFIQTLVTMFDSTPSATTIANILDIWKFIFQMRVNHSFGFVDNKEQEYLAFASIGLHKNIEVLFSSLTSAGRDVLKESLSEIEALYQQLLQAVTNPLPPVYTNNNSSIVFPAVTVSGNAKKNAVDSRP